MPEFVCGQRWINDARLEMGLGSVIETDLRTVTIVFHAAGETLTYASANAPLTRVRFSRDDHITDNDKRSLKIESVIERDGLPSYIGREMLSGGFPGLPDDGMTLTYDREEALINEDIQFLSWDHPLVSGAMELISSNELGNCAFTAVKYAGMRLEAVRVLVAI